MIKIKLKENLITIEGHANYSETEDIVCASVSSIMYTTVNGILELNHEAITYTDDKGLVTIKINSNDDVTKKLIDNMISLFKELETDYPKNVKIYKEEI